MILFLFRVDREKVREEYDSLVQNIFTAASEIKKKYDEFRYEKTRTISSRQHVNLDLDT